MKYRPLGRTGLQVSTLCLGTAHLGSFTDLDESVRIIQTAIDLGVNWIDTASTYGDHRFSIDDAPEDRPMVEEIVGRALRGRRHEVILATKVCEPIGQGVNQRGLSRRFIMDRIEDSLTRLQTDFVDVYYAHHVDPATPIEETLRAFDDLVHSGKVRYIGLSNFAGWQMTEALWAASQRNLSTPQAIQILFNLLYRKPEEEQLPAAAHFGLGVMIYSPLAGGVLTGKYRDAEEGVPQGSRASRRRGKRGSTGKGQAPKKATRPSSGPQLDPRYLRAATRLAEMAESRGHTAAQEAMAWVLGHPAVTSVVSAASSVAQLEANIPAFELELSEEEREEISEVVAEEAG